MKIKNALTTIALAAAQALAENPPAIITLTDGSVIQGKITAPTLPAETLFGAVEIPVDKITSVAFQAAAALPHDEDPRAAAGNHDPRPVYWNTFDSEEETRNPRVGGAGVLEGGKIVEGKFGKALHTGGNADAYKISIPPNTLKPKGCIEFWAKIEPKSDSFADGSWLRFFWMGHARFEFAVNNGMAAGGITSFIANSVSGSSDFGRQTRFSEVLGPDYRDWHHYALVWNDEGVDVGEGGQKPWSAIFVDGKPVSHETNRGGRGPQFTFGAAVGKELFLTLAGSAYAPDGWRENAVPFAMDELKIWGCDKTEFDVDP